MPRDYVRARINGAEYLIPKAWLQGAAGSASRMGLPFEESYLLALEIWAEQHQLAEEWAEQHTTEGPADGE